MWNCYMLYLEDTHVWLYSMILYPTRTCRTWTSGLQTHMVLQWRGWSVVEVWLVWSSKWEIMCLGCGLTVLLLQAPSLKYQCSSVGNSSRTAIRKKKIAFCCRKTGSCCRLVQDHTWTIIFTNITTRHVLYSYSLLCVPYRHSLKPYRCTLRF